MPDDTATGHFDADISDLLSQLDTLESELKSVEGNFEGVGSTASASLNQANNSAHAAAGGMRTLTSSVSPLRAMTGIFGAVAGSVRLLVSALGAAAPYINGLPDSIHSKWIPGLKTMFAHVGLTNAGLQAMNGRLGLLGAAFAYSDARALGASRALAGFGSVGALVASKTISGFRAVGNVIGNVASSIASMAASVGPAGAAVAGAGVAMATVFAGLTATAAAVNKASHMEDFQASFTTILGSADAAQKRIEDLSDFAAKTPFEIPEVVQASKTLETLTRGALSTGDGLRMAGDAAAVTGQPISELATWFGRLYDGLESGRPVGEALMRLQELGLVSGDVRTKIEEMQKSGAKGSNVWSVAAEQFGKYSGEMERRSKTFSGQMSNFKDVFGQLMGEFGKPIMRELTPLLAELVKHIGELKPIMRVVGELVALIASSVGMLIGVKPEKQTDPNAKLTPTDQQQASSGLGNELKVSKMQSVGGGGSFNALGGGSDPILSETRRQTGVLERIERAIREGRPMATPISRPQGLFAP